MDYKMRGALLFCAAAAAFVGAQISTPPIEESDRSLRGIDVIILVALPLYLISVALFISAVAVFVRGGRRNKWR